MEKQQQSVGDHHPPLPDQEPDVRHPIRIWRIQIRPAHYPVWATRLTPESATRTLTLTPESATRRFRSASETISPFALRITAISGRYLIMEPTPQVLEVGAHCCSHFGFIKTWPYKPHSSLFYGKLTKETERIQKRIEELDGGIVGLEFVVCSIDLSKTNTKDKSLQSWKIYSGDLQSQINFTLFTVDVYHGRKRN